MRGSHISLSDCLDDQFGVWDDQGSNRKTSDKSQTTSSEMSVGGNASSSYKEETDRDRQTERQMSDEL